jgi:hypothetical protein
MTADEQTKLNETLSKVFKLDTEKLATLYNEAGDLTDLTVVIDADEKRIARFTTEKTGQYNRGIKEGASKIEKEIKEKYGVESEVIGVELVDQVVLKQVEEATKAGSKDISKHPEYIKLQGEIDKKLKDRDKEWQDKLEKREQEFNNAKLFEKVKDKALANLEARKPILPADPKKAQFWRETYLNELRSYNFQEVEDGGLVVLNKEGKRMEDSHGYAVSFDEFEKSIADKCFEYPTAQQRSSAGNQSTTQQGGTGEVKTKADALAKLKEPKITPEDRKKFTELYETLKD